MPATPAPDAAEPWTRREILQQPATLRATQAVLDGLEAEIAGFLAPLITDPGMRIMLTGAGTSAFIGQSLAPLLSARLARTVEAVPTTDIVSAPGLYLQPQRPTLLVSFGRSGNSPESVAALDLADAHVAEVHHLVITCNEAGALARRGGDRSLTILLPTETHDRGFAMTSSFTAMLYAAHAAFTGVRAARARVETIACGVEGTIRLADPLTATLARRGFERVVYVGSGGFTGLAREAALKLLELTDGGLVTSFDSAMGLRHGPKTIINPATLVVLFLSSDPLTRRYDLDLLAELRREGRCGAVLPVTAQPLGEDELLVPGMAEAPDADLLYPYIVPAQLFGLHSSLVRGLAPDEPNASGTVNRVVQGVRIHAAAA